MKKTLLTLLFISTVYLASGQTAYIIRDNVKYNYHTYWRCDELLTKEKDKDAILFAVFEYLINEEKYDDYVPIRLDIETINYLKPEEFNGRSKDDIYVLMDIQNIHTKKILQLHFSIRWTVVNVYQSGDGL